MKPTARHLSPLLLGLLLMGCGGVLHRAPTISQGDAKPPEAVVQAVALRWPGARIIGASRTFHLSLDGPWSEYGLLIELPGRSVPIESNLWADGTIRWVHDPLEPRSWETAEQEPWELRCRAE